MVQINLSKEQEEAVRFYKGCCEVVASAGSGKTTVIVNRVENLIRNRGIPPEKILVVTFSRKTKEELQSRLVRRMSWHGTDVEVTTFHALGWKIIRDCGGKKYRLLKDDAERMKIINHVLSGFPQIRKDNGYDASYYFQQISAFKNRMDTPDPNTVEGAVYYAYERYKGASHCFDFDDLLINALKILQNDSHAREIWQDKYEFVLVDEMQDISALQYALLRMICQKHKNLFVVGDPLQNIYQWRGGDSRFMMNFADDWSGAVVMHLHTNYRCSQNIVDAANRFAECIPAEDRKYCVKSEADRPLSQDAVYRPCASETDEAEFVRDEITRLIDEGYAYRDIAILARTNEYIQTVSSALSASHIPYTTAYGISSFTKPEAILMICYLRLIDDHKDDDAFAYIYCRPRRNLGAYFLTKTKEIAASKHISFFEAIEEAALVHPQFPPHAKKLRTLIEVCGNTHYRSVGALIGDLRKSYGIDQFVTDSVDYDADAIENLDRLEHMASDYSGINQFLDDVQSTIEHHQDVENTVHLLTIHKAKGLEFPVIFVVGLNNGLFPNPNNKNTSEEKRLLYVAMTRAENLLYVSSVVKDAAENKEQDFVDATTASICLYDDTKYDDADIHENFRDYGDFTWIVCGTSELMLQGLKCATLTRLILLSAYMDYEGVLVCDNGDRMTTAMMQDILHVGYGTLRMIIKELKSADVMTFGKDIRINPKIAFRGRQNRVEQAMLSQENKIITRLYRNGIRALCNFSDGVSANKRSYLFRIMPFVNREYNIVCFNPCERNLTKINPISLSDLSEMIGYGRSQAYRLKSLLLDPVFETANGISNAVHYVPCAEIGGKHNCLFINPEVYYGGSRHNEVRILGRFG